EWFLFCCPCPTSFGTFIYSAKLMTKKEMLDSSAYTYNYTCRTACAVVHIFHLYFILIRNPWGLAPKPPASFRQKSKGKTS
ncbi:hypothetical protein, partial [Bacillus wiedmannii]|uniref:hypothetical protein n=1 Tax=Bacillus wiedmannii TaxID=1890302 RepID=UPI001C54EA22